MVSQNNEMAAILVSRNNEMAAIIRVINLMGSRLLGKAGILKVRLHTAINREYFVS